MKIEINGAPLSEWKYTQAGSEDWSYHETLQRIPCDGSARLLDGSPMVVAHLRKTGTLCTNVVGDEVPCDLPIHGVGFFTI